MKYSFFILFAFLGFLSCDSSSPVNELAPPQITSMPLQIGNTWNYSVTKTSSLTNETEIDSAIFTVVSDTVVHGIHWFLIKSDNQIHDRLVGGYYSNQEDGIHHTVSLSEIPQKTTFSSIPLSKKISKNLIVNQLSSTANDNSTGSTNALLFLHNPDIEITERLIKNDFFIGSINYLGVSNNSLLNIDTNGYTREYYQIFDRGRKYGVEPAKLNYEISNKIGFVVFENAYFSFSTSEENDQRLSLAQRYRYELIEYSIN